MAMGTQLSCEDVDEYRRNLKVQLRSLTESPSAKDALTGAGEWVMLLVRRTGADAAARAPKKVQPHSSCYGLSQRFQQRVFCTPTIFISDNLCTRTSHMTV